MSTISAVDFNNMPEIQPGDNVFDYMLSSFRGVVFDSLFSTFNLGGILADNLVHTSEVDTIKSVRTEGINNGKVIHEYDIYSSFMILKGMRRNVDVIW